MVAAAFASAATPAAAERIQTYWRLVPVVPEAPASVAFGAPFFEQRLLPVRLVQLTEPAVAGGRTLPAGTFLYLVFNADGKIGFCTIKDRSAGNKAKTLFIPLLDQRPCLVDGDEDGRFDKMFSVYDKDGGPPAARGSINGAQPLPGAPGYREVDPAEFPSELRVALKFVGKRDPAKAKLDLDFSRKVGDWPFVRGVPSGSGSTFSVMNVVVQLVSVAGDTAHVNLSWADGVYLHSNNRGTLFWSPLPDFVRVGPPPRSKPGAGTD